MPILYFIFAYTCLILYPSTNPCIIRPYAIQGKDCPLSCVSAILSLKRFQAHHELFSTTSYKTRSQQCFSASGWNDPVQVWEKVALGPKCCCHFSMPPDYSWVWASSSKPLWGRAGKYLIYMWPTCHSLTSMVLKIHLAFLPLSILSMLI